MKKLLYLIPLTFAFLLSFSACGDDDETIPNPKVPAYWPDLEIMLVDAEGNNLLNLDNNPINIEGAKLLYDGKEYPLVDKIKKSTRAAEMLPFGFYKFIGVINDLPQVLLIIAPFKNPELDKEHKLTIDWGNDTSDEIKFRYIEITEKVEYGRNIYLNGEFCGDDIVKIVKERP